MPWVCKRHLLGASGAARCAEGWAYASPAPRSAPWLFAGGRAASQGQQSQSGPLSRWGPPVPLISWHMPLPKQHEWCICFVSWKAGWLCASSTLGVTLQPVLKVCNNTGSWQHVYSALICRWSWKEKHLPPTFGKVPRKQIWPKAFQLIEAKYRGFQWGTVSTGLRGHLRRALCLGIDCISFLSPLNNFSVIVHQVFSWAAAAISRSDHTDAGALVCQQFTCRSQNQALEICLLPSSPSEDAEVVTTWWCGEVEAVVMAENNSSRELPMVWLLVWVFLCFTNNGVDVDKAMLACALLHPACAPWLPGLIWSRWSVVCYTWRQDRVLPGFSEWRKRGNYLVIGQYFTNEISSLASKLLFNHLCLF